MSSAVHLTEKGHEQYKAGNYAAAIDLYDKALTTAKLPAHLVALQSNRAACYLKLKNYTKVPCPLYDYAVRNAAEACSGVLQLDPSHEGLLLLRARTLQTMKDFQGALFDCNRLLQLKPSNAAYTALHARLQEQIAGCAELSAITEHDIITSDSLHTGAAAAPHSNLEARSGRKVSFGVGSETPSPHPSLPSPNSTVSENQSTYQTLEKLPTQSPTQKVAFLSAHRLLPPVSQDSTELLPIPPPSRTESLPTPSLISPGDRLSHRVIFSHDTKSDITSNPNLISDISVKIMKRIPTPFRLLDQAQPSELISDSQPPTEASHSTLSPFSDISVARQPSSFPSRTVSLPAPSSSTHARREKASHRVGFDPILSIPGAGEHGVQQPPSPISEKIQKRAKTPHCRKSTIPIWQWGGGSPSSFQGILPGDGEIEEGVVDSEIPFEDAQLPPHSPIPLSQGMQVGGVKKGLPTTHPMSHASRVSDVSRNPSSSLTMDAKEFRTEDCDEYTLPSSFKTLEVSPRVDRAAAPLRDEGEAIVVQKSWNGIGGPTYVRQQAGKKGVEGDAMAADGDRYLGGGGGAKGYRLPLMPMAPLPYDANPSRVEVGRKKVVIQMDPEVKAKAVVSVQPAQKKTDYSSWDNLEVSSDEEEEPKPQYHYKITNMKVQAVADK